MALNRTIIKNSSKEVVVKFDGANGATGINLTELAAADQVLGASGASDYAAPKINIAAYSSIGQLNSSLQVTRNGTTVIAAAPENAPTVQLNQLGLVDNVNNDKDFVVTHGGATGAIVETYLVLHKVDGYYSKVEYEKYGSYDDETFVGTLDISGTTPPAGLYDLPVPGSGTFDTGAALTMTSVGTPYTPGDSVSSITNEKVGLWRKKYKGNFGTSAGSGIDVTFVRNNPGFFGKADTYVSFGSQNLASEENYTFEWVGYFKAPTTATYNFWCTTDDDTYFWIGTNALGTANTNSNYHMYKSNTVRGKNTNSVDLTAGEYYPVRIQFGEYTGAEKCQILWGRTTDTEAVAGNDGTTGTQVWYHNGTTKGH